MDAKPSQKVCVLIQADPFQTHRAVEALRIALGLGSHNEGQDITIILAGRAPHLLAQDTSEIVDGEILEKHIPVFIEWGTPFGIAANADAPSHYVSDCITKPITTVEIARALAAADRVLVF